MPVYDYECTNGHLFEDRCSMADRDNPRSCPECSSDSHKVMLGVPATLTTIIPSYPGCKKQRAGYVHSHGDKAATRVSSGYGGCTNPRTNELHPIAQQVQCDPVSPTAAKRLAS